MKRYPNPIAERDYLWRRPTLWWFLLALGLLVAIWIKGEEPKAPVGLEERQTREAIRNAQHRKEAETSDMLPPAVVVPPSIYSNSVTLVWDDPNIIAVTKYRVYWSSNNSFAQAKIFVVTNRTCYLTNLFNTNIFAVTAVDANGLESDMSNIFTNRSLGIPPRYSFTYWARTGSVATARSNFSRAWIVGVITNLPGETNFGLVDIEIERKQVQ